MDDSGLQAKLRHEGQVLGSDAMPTPGVVRLGSTLYQRRAEVIRRSEELNRSASAQLDAAAHARVARDRGLHRGLPSLGG
jgi:hypothetical protein